MSLAKNMWATLSKVDVRKHIQQKGQLNYLSWAWAWGALMEHYPNATYTFSDRTFSDGSMEVYCDLVITEDGESITRHMWLAVMGNRNEAILNPDSTQVNKAKMRCLTKAIGMCGLGYHIYAGEDLILDEIAPVAKDLSASVDAIRNAITETDPSSCLEAWGELSKQEKSVVWKQFSKTEQVTIEDLLKVARGE